MDILEILQAKVGFTGTEIKIADYVLEHCRQVSGISANALARETFSSTVSVIRICRKMGVVSTIPALFHEKPYRDKKSLAEDVALFIAYSDCGLQEEMALFRKRGQSRTLSAFRVVISP